MNPNGSRPLRWALIGSGHVARGAHLPILARNPKVTVVAIADTQADSLFQANALVPQAKTYGTLSEILRSEKIDIVDICTPPSSHAVLILEALQSGAHVLCEKPLVLNVDDMERIRRRSARTGRLVYSVHNWKFAPQFLLVKRWIREGLIGKLLNIEIHTWRTAPAFTSGAASSTWRLDVRQAGGGVLVDHGWHLFSLALGFAKETPQSIWCRLSRERFKAAGLDDTALCGIEFPSVKTFLYMSWAEQMRRNMGVFSGDQGTVFLDDDRAWVNPRRGQARMESFQEPLSAGSSHPDWFEPMLSDFFGELEHPESRTNFDEAALCLSLLSGAYESARQGSRAIELESERRPVTP